MQKNSESKVPYLKSSLKLKLRPNIFFSEKKKIFGQKIFFIVQIWFKKFIETLQGSKILHNSNNGVNLTVEGQFDDDSSLVTR